jgi:hypothetical protein
MRANPTWPAGGVGCEKITPCRKNYTAVLISRFEAVRQFCFGCCQTDTTVVDYNRLLFESQEHSVVHHLLIVGVATTIVAAAGSALAADMAVRSAPPAFPA